MLENMVALASQGLLVLALASKGLSSKVDQLKVSQRGVVDHGRFSRRLVGLYDPPRPETAGAVIACHQSGIAVHMVTGDHPSSSRESHYRLESYLVV
jgi:P-type Na+/K+ transporter